MKINYLKTLVELVKQKNMTKTARALQLTQPAISKQIKALEKYYDNEILVRYSGEIKLTNKGEKIYEYALNMINLEKKLFRDIDNKELEYSGDFDIWTSNIPASSYLPTILAKFLKNYKLATANVLLKDTKDVTCLVSSGKASFGFVGKSFQNNNVECLEVFNSDMVLVGSSCYKNLEVSEKNLKNMKFIVRENGSATRESLEQYLIDKKIELCEKNIAVILENNELILKMLEMGKFLALLPLYEVKGRADLAVIDVCSNKKFYYIYNKNRYMSALERAFHEFILSNS